MSFEQTEPPYSDVQAGAPADAGTMSDSALQADARMHEDAKAGQDYHALAENRAALLLLLAQRFGRKSDAPLSDEERGEIESKIRLVRTRRNNPHAAQFALQRMHRRNATAAAHAATTRREDAARQSERHHSHAD